MIATQPTLPYHVNFALFLSVPPAMYSNNVLPQTTRTTREVTDIYCVAAENLRERRGVTSMTNVKLAKTLPIFKFGPSRLVVRGLAPAHLLKPTTTPAPPDENDYDLCDGEGDIVDNEGFDETEIAHQQQVGTKPSNLPKRKTMHERIHAVLLGAGVEIRVKETRPLLKALGLLRCRLIGLGLIPRDNLRVNLQPGSALEEMFTVAARNLREHHGVPSMTPEMLVHTLAVLELRPSRLVGTGMAPKKYLRGGRKVAAADGGGKSSDNGEDESHNRLEPVASCDTDNQDHHREGPNAIHDAFVREGIKIQPPEAMALILALRVAPARLAKLGMVDPKQLRRFVRRFRRKGRQSGTRKHQNGSVCGDHVVPKRTSQK